MTEGEGYSVLGDTETEGEGRPRVARVIGREAGMELAEAAVHTSHKVTVILHVFAPREQEAGATIAVYDFPCFRRHEDGIKTVRLAAVKFDTTIMHAVGREGKQVANINAEQTEGETEAVEIALLPRLDVESKERTQLIEGEVTLGSFDGTDLELAERIEGRQFLVDGEVEDRANIPQVYVASIDRGRLTGEIEEEGAQPVGSDIGKGKQRGGLVELRNALPSGFVDFTGTAVFQSADILMIDTREGNGFGFGGRGGGEHKVTQLASGAVGTEVWRHKDRLKQAVIIAETVEQVIIQSLAVRTNTHTRAHRVPFRGEDGLGQGNERSRAVMIDLYAEGARTVMLRAASVEVKFEGSHIFFIVAQFMCSYFAAKRGILQPFAATETGREGKGKPAN